MLALVLTFSMPSPPLIVALGLLNSEDTFALLRAVAVCAPAL